MSYSVPATQTSGPALNAITSTVRPDRAQRRARQMAMCQRLAELGMELAEAAQREALRETRPHPERRAPTMPGLPAPPDPAYRDTTFGELFTQVARCVRQAILLEARIDGGSFDHPAPAGRTPRDEPAHATPRAPHAPGDATRLACERLEDDLAVDARRSPEAILAGIADELGSVIVMTPTSQPRPTQAVRRPAAAAAQQTGERPPNRPANERPPPKPG